MLFAVKISIKYPPAKGSSRIEQGIERQITFTVVETVLRILYGYENLETVKSCSLSPCPLFSCAESVKPAAISNFPVALSIPGSYISAKCGCTQSTTEDIQDRIQIFTITKIKSVTKVGFAITIPKPKDTLLSLDVSFREVVCYSKARTSHIHIHTGLSVSQPRPRTMRFYAFSKVNEKLRGKRFTDAEEAAAAYEKTVEATSRVREGKVFPSNSATY
ncbi:hypothetical protein EVAR_35594_1 [Eumeta japonica]|uniref:Uncharacterized protein n=1 Tax=Eumeta variegata TaxID=151549 RepID=A0A4C1WFQ6_EUMVA|nr:hypothetical protein EVAR_35594_1 [Eumeta japonica]